MTSPVIEIRNLTKDFTTDFWKPKFRSLENVSFTVPEEGIFGLIGHNGAGKTTAIKILIGLLRPTSGEVFICNQPVTDSQVKRWVGYLPENAYYYEFLKAGEILHFYGKLFGFGRKERDHKVDELLELVGLRDRTNDKLKTFSKGMLQRIGIAQALINDPKVVILDEPMSGLDPLGRKEVRDIILRLAEKKKTILFSSHILSDVEAICDQVAILVKGKLKASGPMAKLVQAKVKTIELLFEGTDEKVVDFPTQKNISTRLVGKNYFLTSKDRSQVNEILLWGKSNNLTLVSVIPHKESLEDLFVEKTGGLV